MDSKRFDEVTRTLASGTSRRRVFGLFAGGLAIAFGSGGRAAHANGNKGGNSACAELCTELFPPGKERGQCIAAGARGEGPCGAPNSCVPDCTGKCGGASDGCGGACTELCCTPDCTGKCGGVSDGCGGTCNAECCTPDCEGKFGGVSDGCGGTCDACPQVGCNTGYPNGDGTCWYTPTGVDGVYCNNLYYQVGDGVCDTMGNCLPGVPWR